MKKLLIILTLFSIFLLAGCQDYGEPFCTDSDGGMDIFTKGTTENERGSVEDVCGEENKVTGLLEYYCNGTTRNSAKIPCNCVDGACIINQGCRDSDGGLDYNLAGYVIDSFGTHQDTCNLANTSLWEFYCASNGSYTQQYYRCPNRCEYGACL